MNVYSKYLLQLTNYKYMNEFVAMSGGREGEVLVKNRGIKMVDNLLHELS